MKREEAEVYEAPMIEEVGSVSEITAALGVTGAEDGNPKTVFRHHVSL